MSGRRVAVITGASAGVGRATVRAFAEHGFDIGLIARGQADLEAAAAEVAASGGRALARNLADKRRHAALPHRPSRPPAAVGR
jgi:NADP-dependent 3-hydroxy acid dehydrogenase YdfG